MGTFKKVHFVGIGGYGMSALAKILHKMNYIVTGSDLNESKITKRLGEMGVEIFYYHSPENIEGADLVVYSTAIPESNPEIHAAKENNIILWHRSELLAYLINTKYGIAVAGTHGKTTTTAMISLILEKAGLDPTAVIGGELTDFDGNAKLGESDYLVAEACESDHSFLRYKPFLAVVTNVEADHLEYYDGSFDKIKETYINFLKNIKDEGIALLCGDDSSLQEIKKQYSLGCVTYGIKEQSDYMAGDIQLKNRGSVFNVYYKGEKLSEIELGVPGEYNIYNALAAIAVARQLGIDFHKIKDILRNFKGAQRRFQIVGEAEGITIVDDYAHHPTEIKETLKAAKSSDSKRIIAVFQPHRYSRTYYLFNDFVKSFSHADLVIITPIYSAGEESIEGISSDILVERIREEEDREVILLETRQIRDYLYKILQPGDMVITMGAGDIWKVSYELAEKIAKVENKSG